MRLSSATLLLGGTSVLSALFVSAAPVLIRISLIDNVGVSREPDNLIRFIRIGGPGAAANVHTPDLERINAAVVSSGMLAGLNSDAPVRVEGENPVPMRPEMEFSTEQDLPFETEGQEVMDCDANMLERVLGNINDFFLDFFGLADETRRARCNMPQAARLSPHSPSTLVPTATYSAEGGTPYHRNGSPLEMVSSSSVYTTMGPTRFRPNAWAYRHRPTTFGGRIQRALYALSPWEGRAVAFVMGCGLGVLIRMLFVFIVLGARMLNGTSRANEADEKEDAIRVVLGDEEFEGVILFDAGSIKGASVEDLPLYEEKQ
jgi:hypothetical protein